MEGSKIIAFSTLIGLTLFVFTTLPFVGFLVAGIQEEENKNNDKSIVEIISKAFGWHLVAVITIIFLVNVLNIVMSKVEPDFIKNKLQTIFWNAHDKGAVFASSSSTAGEYEAEAAYSFLFVTYTFIQMFYAIIPIILFFLAVYIGWKTVSVDQNASFMSILIHMGGYGILGLLVYIAWIWTADLAMFMKAGESLFELKNAYWKELFGIT